MNYQEFLDNCWEDYILITPSAKRVKNLLAERGETLVNDHIAFRTFANSEVDLQFFKESLAAYGLVKKGEYHFESKKLRAAHFEHKSNPELPKVFVSELLCEDESFSIEFKALLRKIVSTIPKNPTLETVVQTKKYWKITFEEYKMLAEESEYASWLAAMGLRANHFTISVNHLNSFKSLEEFNQFLKDNEFELNQSGGEIKGSQLVSLEQSSTLADRIKIGFTDGPEYIPSCYVEFAMRYPDEDGNLFQGFIEGSADRIFESTYEQS